MVGYFMDWEDTAIFTLKLCYEVYLNFSLVARFYGKYIEKLDGEVQ